MNGCSSWLYWLDCALSGGHSDFAAGRVAMESLVFGVGYAVGVFLLSLIPVIASRSVGGDS